MPQKSRTDGSFETTDGKTLTPVATILSDDGKERSQIVAEEDQYAVYLHAGGGKYSISDKITAEVFEVLKTLPSLA